MSKGRSAWNLIWRSAAFAVGYTLALIIAGGLGALLSSASGASTASPVSLLSLVVSSFLMVLVLGPLARRIPASRSRHALIWMSLIFGNLGSVAIEGVYFAPDLVPLPLSAVFLQQLVAAILGAILLSRLFATPGVSPSARTWFARRPAVSWVWRFAAATLSYLLFYFVFGALNYQLVTGPYYATHVGGLAVPAPQVVLMAELARAPLIVLSLVPLLFTYAIPRRRMLALCGFLLFWVGGVVPLVLQSTNLPPALLVASGIEIFFQNFLTGVVVAGLLWTGRAPD